MGHLILALFLFFTSYSYAGSWAGQYESVVISDKFYVSYEWGIMPPHNVPERSNVLRPCVILVPSFVPVSVRVRVGIIVTVGVYVMVTIRAFLNI